MIKFSKQALRNELEIQVTKMENTWKFVSTNGTNQIKDRTDFDRIVAYGEYIALISILESISDNSFLN